MTRNGSESWRGQDGHSGGALRQRSLHRDDVLTELLERLGAMGIEPIGATDRVPSLVERREWAPPASDNDSPDEVAETLKRTVSTDGESV